MSGQGQPRPAKFTTGFWFWEGSSYEPAWSGAPLDVLFVQVGTIRSPDRAFGRLDGHYVVTGAWPNNLPKAAEYWAVFRYEHQGVPDLQAAPMIAAEVSSLWTEAKKRNINAAGVQLDIDSPTGSLAQYAAFLREVRKGLPPGFQISITSLLDWFRPGTAVPELLREVDEFVPQFYDLAGRDSGDGTAIASPIDAARWGPVFNRYRKRYRVGISTFGRARMASKETETRSQYRRVVFFGDLSPLDIAINPAFELHAGQNQANELVLSYRATRKTRIGYNEFNADDTLQFILSTPDGVRASVDSVRRMGGNLAGVLFFRWPTAKETLAMQPDEVLIAAGIQGRDNSRPNRIQTVNGHCAAVECVDVYFECADPLSAKPARYRINSSTELEYFVPERNIPARMAGPSRLELSLPPYCGRGRLYIGRAVSRERTEFTVAEEL